MDYFLYICEVQKFNFLGREVIPLIYMEMFNYFKTKDTFEEKLSTNVVQDTDICFIEDTQEI